MILVVTAGHAHVFICRRYPHAHYFQTACREHLVLCPECGSGGENIVLEVGEED